MSLLPSLDLSLLPLLAMLTACTGGFSDPSRELGEPVTGQVTGRVEIHRPPTMGVLDTPLQDVHGAPIGVACDTCHGPDADGEVLAQAQDNPEGMHQALEHRHGALACDACHDPDDRRFLHLADGTLLEMPRAMELCAQCHGPQHRDYQRGSHGGMTGSWDLRRGDRVRNHCLDCHDAHAPAWSQLDPVFPPMDRGTVSQRTHDSGSH